MFVDSACRGGHFRDAVRAKGGVPRIVATGGWGRYEQETLRRLKERNQPIYRVRGRIEQIFGNMEAPLRLAPTAPFDHHAMETPNRILRGRSGVVCWRVARIVGLPSEKRLALASPRFSPVSEKS